MQKWRLHWTACKADKDHAWRIYRQKLGRRSPFKIPENRTRRTRWADDDTGDAVLLCFSCAGYYAKKAMLPQSLKRATVSMNPFRLSP